MLVGTFLLVYLVVPSLVVIVLHQLPIEHPERIRQGVAMLVLIVTYAFLRRRFGNGLPQV